MAEKPLRRAEAVRLAWEKGYVRWKLDANQIGVLETFERTREQSRKHVWNMSRQLGKSFLLCAYAAEFALQNPGAQIKYAAPTAKMVKKIVRPHFRKIFEDCPKHLKPTFHTQDGEYRFPNGSTITVAGCDRENAETLRGQHAHLAIVDEAGFVSDLSYVIDGILMPQTLNTKGVIIVVSTPAKSAGHPFKQLCDAADENGTYIHRTIFDNPRLTQEEIESLKKEAGGEESTTWKREYLCQHVTDETSAVIPEATAEWVKHITLALQGDDDLSYRPRHFDTYVWMDVGWSPDFTGILWAIADFEKATVTIEDEYLMRRMDTDALASVLTHKTNALWGYNHRPWRCISELDYRLIADLAKRGWQFQPAEKDNKDAAINTLRMCIVGKAWAMKIHPRCKAFRRQLQNVTWNKSRSSFDRSDLDGHYDLIDAAIYGRRHLDTSHNPHRGTPFNHKTGIKWLEDSPASKAAAAIGKLWGA
jgi:hypothetical protein